MQNPVFWFPNNSSTQKSVKCWDIACGLSSKRTNWFSSPKQLRRKMLERRNLSSRFVVALWNSCITKYKGIVTSSILSLILNKNIDNKKVLCERKRHTGMPTAY